MNFAPECKRRVSAAFSSFGSKARMSQFGPNFFQTLFLPPGRFLLTVQHKYKEFGCFFLFLQIITDFAF